MTRDCSITSMLSVAASEPFCGGVYKGRMPAVSKEQSCLQVRTSLFGTVQQLCDLYRFGGMVKLEGAGKAARHAHDSRC